MKYLNKLVILVLLLLTVAVKAELRTINYIANHKVYALKDSLIFTAGQSGIFVSSDNGVHWESRNLGFSDQNFTTIFVDGENIYAGTLQGYLYKSSDNGDTWVYFNTNPKLRRINAIWASKNRILAASSDVIIESKDGGNNWQLFDSLKTNIDINSITFFSEKFFIGSNFYGAYYYNSDKKLTNVSLESPYRIVYNIYPKKDRLYICSDAGAVYSTDSSISAWKKEFTCENNPIYSVFINDKDIFVLTSQNGVLTTKNSGQSWDTLKIFDKLNALGKFANKGDSIYLFSNFGIKIFGFNGKLIPVTKLNELDTIIVKSSYQYKDTVYLINDKFGLCKTHVSKFEPVKLNNSAFKGPLLSIAGCGNYLFVVDKSYHTFKSLDFGNTWSQCISDFWEIKEAIEFAGKLFAYSTYSFNVSLDSGNTWTLPSLQMNYIYINQLFNYKEKLFVTSWGRPYLSLDSGNNWSNVSDNFNDIVNRVRNMVNIRDTVIGFVYDSLNSYVYFTPDKYEWRQSHFNNPISSQIDFYTDRDYFIGINNNSNVFLASYDNKAWYGTSYSYYKDYNRVTRAYSDSNNLYFLSSQFGVLKLNIPKSLKAPINLGPKNGALQTNSQCIVRWSPSSGAISYTIQLALDSNFDYVVYEKTVPTFSEFITLKSNTKYFSRMRADFVDIHSPWSSVESFVTGVSAVDEPIAKDDYELYPNPASDFITLKSATYFDLNTSVKIFDLLGNLLFEAPIPNRNDFIIPTGSFTQGSYILQISGLKTNVIKHFSVVK